MLAVFETLLLGKNQEKIPGDLSPTVQDLLPPPPDPTQILQSD